MSGLNTLRTALPSEKTVLPKQKTDSDTPLTISGAAKRIVRREIWRALSDVCLLPWRALCQCFGNEKLKRAIQEDLRSVPSFAPDDRDLDLPARPLRIFISCAEASGETHAVNWVRSLRRIIKQSGAPQPELYGLGGDALRDEGVQTLGDPVSDARMGFSGVLDALPFYVGLLRASTQTFLGGSIDLFVAVDSPALHVPLGHMARRCGVTAVHYITPQYWGWAPWRVKGFREAFDLALSILPFEPSWFARHGVQVTHVGHPQLDAFPALDREEPRPKALAILPGSRRSIIERNLPLMLAQLKGHLDPPNGWHARVLQSSPKHRQLIEECIAKSGLDTNGIELSFDLEQGLRQSSAALSVSGTILTHLLHHRLPTVVIYRLESSLQQWIGQRFLTVPYFSSVNLLAGEEVYPEFSFAADQPPVKYVEAVRRLLVDADWREETAARLEGAAQRLGPPGANRRAAWACLDLACRNGAGKSAKSPGTAP